ncbi:hypothetical protein N658DRAFT_229164 [Parathielavia hyrcaniae]|uniref:Uncharacterized protein n=1 Tax=Parathielavia hyrcaniae TaxID=113614 RepID=A0AAN6SZ24_9PEZI|nr:hypothetical protein N658DRAFT_229164 [Parathielavia hyrcaniae]
MTKKMEPVKGLAHGGTEEPAILRPPRPSPSQRFAWRSSARGHDAGIKSKGNGGGSALCPLPDCVKAAEPDGSGADKKMLITNSMMKAYVAMRAGVNSVAASTTEPLLGELAQQELAGELGCPQLVHNIDWELNPYLPDLLNRPEVYYYARNVIEEHLRLPPNYSFRELSAINESRSDGWKTANAKED